jgi:hypothetical protein
MNNDLNKLQEAYLSINEAKQTSKYIRLTTTAGLNVGDIIYTDTHGGKTPCRVVEINHDDNTVFAPYQETWDKYQTRSKFEFPRLVTDYYVRSTRR